MLGMKESELLENGLNNNTGQKKLKKKGNGGQMEPLGANLER